MQNWPQTSLTIESTPFFSIILPTYNRASLLREAIRSVVQQTYTNWELIVVDDGSTDDTREVVAAFGDDRIRYYFQPNRERAASRNRGVALARGQYCCFLDDDDLFTASHLETLYQLIEKTGTKPAVYKVGGFLFQDTPTGRTIDLIPNRNRLADLWQVGLSLQFTAIPRVFFREWRFEPFLAQVDDFFFFLQCLDQYPLITSEEYTVGMRLHPARTTNWRSRIHILRFLARGNYVLCFVQKHHLWAKAIGPRELTRKRSQIYLQAANKAAKAGYLKWSMYLSCQGVRYAPLLGRTWIIALRNTTHCLRRALRVSAPTT